MKFNFGDNIRDRITGFEGRCVGFTAYITGCAGLPAECRTPLEDSIT